MLWQMTALQTSAKERQLLATEATEITEDDKAAQHRKGPLSVSSVFSVVLHWFCRG